MRYERIREDKYIECDAMRLEAVIVLNKRDFLSHSWTNVNNCRHEKVYCGAIVFRLSSDSVDRLQFIICLTSFQV